MWSCESESKKYMEKIVRTIPPKIHWSPSRRSKYKIKWCYSKLQKFKILVEYSQLAENEALALVEKYTSTSMPLVDDKYQPQLYLCWTTRLVPGGRWSRQWTLLYAIRLANGNNKAPGIDRVSSKFYKYASLAAFLNEVTSILNDVLLNNLMSKSFCESIIIPVRKKVI